MAPPGIMPNVVGKKLIKATAEIEGAATGTVDVQVTSGPENPDATVASQSPKPQDPIGPVVTLVTE